MYNIDIFLQAKKLSAIKINIFTHRDYNCFSPSDHLQHHLYQIFFSSQNLGIIYRRIYSSSCIIGHFLVCPCYTIIAQTSLVPSFFPCAIQGAGY